MPLEVTIIILLFLLIIIVSFLGRRYLFKKDNDLEERNKRLTALRKLDEIMLSASTDPIDVAQKVTDAISFELGFTIGVLALIDEKKGVLRRVAMSRTKAGDMAKQVLPMNYEKLETPLNYERNLCIQAIRDNERKITHNLYDVFVPTLDIAVSEKVQKTVNVKTSLIYPVRARGRTIGVMIVSLSQTEAELPEYEREVIENLVYVVGIALDNARLYQDLKITSTQLERANLKLKELDKLKDDFVSIASHELRTPMTAIRSYSWMALNRADVPLSEKLKKYLTRTLVSTERLINLVNDMLNISRIESGRVEITPKVFDIEMLVDDVLQEVEVKAKEKNIHLISHKVALPKVFADSDKVHQVLLNLLGNAMKFTPQDGMIDVSFLSDGKFLDISVHDSGVGISKEDLSRLFTKFGRLDNSYVAAATSGGTGLGLYICKSLVELMGGKIWVNSEGLGKGSTFTFSLPIANQQVLSNVAKFTRRSLEGEGKPLEPVSL